MSTPTVTIDRPPAVVTIVIQGTTHKLTEQEARDLHQRLATTLGLGVNVRQDQFPPARWHQPLQYVQSPTTGWPLPETPICTSKS